MLDSLINSSAVDNARVRLKDKLEAGARIIDVDDSGTGSVLMHPSLPSACYMKL